MKKISIAFLAAMSLASFGCKKKGGGGEALAKMTEFKDKMCACKDKACTDSVNQEMAKWSTEQAKPGEKPAAISEEDTKKLAAVSEEMTKCLTKIVTEAAGAPGAAGGTAADPAAGGTAAEPAAGGSAAEPAAGGSAAEPAAGGSAAEPAGGSAAAPTGGSADGSAK